MPRTSRAILDPKAHNGSYSSSTGQRPRHAWTWTKLTGGASARGPKPGHFRTRKEETCSNIKNLKKQLLQREKANTTVHKSVRNWLKFALQKPRFLKHEDLRYFEHMRLMDQILNRMENQWVTVEHEDQPNWLKCLVKPRTKDHTRFFKAFGYLPSLFFEMKIGVRRCIWFFKTSFQNHEVKKVWVWQVVWLPLNEESLRSKSSKGVFFSATPPWRVYFMQKDTYAKPVYNNNNTSKLAVGWANENSWPCT